MITTKWATQLFAATTDGGVAAAMLRHLAHASDIHLIPPGRCAIADDVLASIVPAKKTSAKIAVPAASVADADGCRRYQGDSRIGVQEQLLRNPRLPDDVAAVLLLRVADKKKQSDTLAAATTFVSFSGYLAAIDALDEFDDRDEATVERIVGRLEWYVAKKVYQARPPDDGPIPWEGDELDTVRSCLGWLISSWGATGGWRRYRTEVAILVAAIAMWIGAAQPRDDPIAELYSNPRYVGWLLSELRDPTPAMLAAFIDTNTADNIDGDSGRLGSAINMRPLSRKTFDEFLPSAHIDHNPDPAGDLKRDPTGEPKCDREREGRSLEKVLDVLVRFAIPAERVELMNAFVARYVDDRGLSFYLNTTAKLPVVGDRYRRMCDHLTAELVANDRVTAQVASWLIGSGLRVNAYLRSTARDRGAPITDNLDTIVCWLQNLSDRYLAEWLQGSGTPTPTASQLRRAVAVDGDLAAKIAGACAHISWTKVTPALINVLCDYNFVALDRAAGPDPAVVAEWLSSRFDGDAAEIAMFMSMTAGWSGTPADLVDTIRILNNTSPTPPQPSQTQRASSSTPTLLSNLDIDVDIDVESSTAFEIEPALLV